MIQRTATLLWLGVALISTGCSSAPPSAIPMRTIAIPASGPRHDTLVVMLPGIKDRAERFVETGFVQRDGSTDDFDLLAVDAHWGYYSDGSIVERLREDVIRPAQARGYKNIWLLGVSLGGFGSLLYAERFPADVRGVVLLAPYLGSHRISAEVTAAGGLAAWRAPARGGDVGDQAWHSLQTLLAEHPERIFLGYGTSDPLRATYDPLLAALPASHVHTIDGGHKWTTWTPLWSQIKQAVTIEDVAPSATAARDKLHTARE